MFNKCFPYHITLLICKLMISGAEKDECRYILHKAATIQDTMQSSEGLRKNVYEALPKAAKMCSEIPSCNGIFQNPSGKYQLAKGFPSTSPAENQVWVKECDPVCSYQRIVNEVTSVTFFDRICSRPESEQKHPPNVIDFWSAWSRCTHPCDSGVQTRRRICSAWKCNDTEEMRECNIGVPCTRKIEQIYGIKGPEGLASLGKTHIYTTCVHTAPEKRLPCGTNRNIVTEDKCDQFRCCFQKPDYLTTGPLCFDSRNYIGSNGRLGWAIWSSWSLCSVTCQIGKRSRHRICTGDLPGSKLCPGVDDEIEACSYGACPCDVNPCVNGGSCITNEEVTSGYYCHCQRGFAGKNCDYDEPILTCNDDSIEVYIHAGIVRDDGLIAEPRLIRFAQTESDDCFARKIGDAFFLSLPPPIDESCGSQMEEDDRKLIIHNKVLWELSGGSIDATVVLVDISCVFYKSINATLDLAFGISPTVRTISKKISKGAFDVRMHIYRDGTFLPSHRYQSDFNIAQGEILYFSVDLRPMRLTTINDTVVFIEECFVVDVEIAGQSRQDLINEGCSTNPLFTTIISNGESKSGKWALRVFDWKNDDQINDVYIQCGVKICSRTCAPKCEKAQKEGIMSTIANVRKKRSKMRENEMYIDEVVLQRKIRFA